MKGVFYALPQTAIDVNMLVSRTTYTRGDLADKLLCSTNKDKLLQRLNIDEAKIPPENEKQYSYQLTEFDLRTSSLPDPENVFFVEMPGGITQDTSLLLEFTEAGMPTEIKSEIADRTLDNIGQILQMVTGAAVKYTTFAGTQTGVSRIEEIVGLIEGVRDARNGLIADSIVSDLVVFERQILELTKVEQKLIANFLKTEIKPWTARFRIVPKDSIDKYPIIAVTESGCCPGVQTFPDNPPLYGPPTGWTSAGTDKVEIHIRRDLPENTLAEAVHGSIGSVDRADPQGFYYRVPVPTQIVLTYQGAVKRQSSAMVAQFGRVAALPRSFNNTNSTIGASLYAQSGALKSINTTTQAIQPETIARFGTAVENIAETASNVRRAGLAASQARAEELRANLELANTLITTALSVAAP
jgi:hypothetical protein